MTFHWLTSSHKDWLGLLSCTDDDISGNSSRILRQPPRHPSITTSSVHADAPESQPRRVRQTAAPTELVVGKIDNSVTPIASEI